MDRPCNWRSFQPESAAQTQKIVQKLNAADGQVKSKMCFLCCLLCSGCLGLLVSPWFYLLVILAVEMDSVGLETAQEGNTG